ncbi:MAG: DUF1674 domain-containing protein [Alphaproteobacteria bacterium]
MSEHEDQASTPATHGERSSGEPAGQQEGEASTGRTRTQPPGEKGGPKGPEPTRFGDWEKNGRCFDF